MPLLNINPLAGAQTPQQIATKHLEAFNQIATTIHVCRTSGIPAQEEKIAPNGQVFKEARPAVTPEEYTAGMIAAIGQEAYDRLVAASEVLVGQQPES